MSRCMGRKVFFRELERIVLQRRGKCVIPAIEEAEHRDHPHDLDHLVIAPMLAKLHKHFVGDGVGNATSGNCHVKGRALGRREQGTRLVAPHRRKFLIIYAELMRALNRMRHAVFAPGGSARGILRSMVTSMLRRSWSSGEPAFTRNNPSAETTFAGSDRPCNRREGFQATLRYA